MKWVVEALNRYSVHGNRYVNKSPRSISKSDSNRLKYCTECENVFEKTRYNNNVVMHGKHIPSFGQERETCKYCEDKK